MSTQWASWFAAIAAAIAMVLGGARTRMLSLPELKVRCGACGRLVWRGRVCACAREPRG